MGYSSWGYFRQPTSYEIESSAEAYIKRQAKKGIILNPVYPKTNARTIAVSWWGISWCKNLERYLDFANRLDRGKKYVRAHAVMDFKEEDGKISALVSGSSPYEIEIRIDPLSKKRQGEIADHCLNRIQNVEDLLNGKFPEELKDVFFAKEGLFPAPKEIHFSCSCPDYASMCKHVAAVMYAIGIKLDDDPLIFFRLRGINPDTFIAEAIKDRVEQMLDNAKKASTRIIDSGDVEDLFGNL